MIRSPQAPQIGSPTAPRSLNFCANNYLGLANHPRDRRGRARRRSTRGATAWRRCASSAARRSCTRSSRQRSPRSSAPTTPSSTRRCFDANGGLFETLLGEEDAIITDELNHACIIDGIRLCKAKRFRYATTTWPTWRRKLAEADAAGARFKLIATDGVFSMDGIIANLQAICDLADRYDALVMVDDSHAVGFVGASGRGTPEHCGVEGRVDIITGTLGKALGGASGGYTRAAREIVDCCASARGRICSPTRWRRASPPPRSRCSKLLASDEGAKLRANVQATTASVSGAR